MQGDRLPLSGISVIEFCQVAAGPFCGMIPTELYEAAKIDGANYWDELRHITLPLILPVLGSLVILRTIFVFNNFDFIFLTTGGGPIDVTSTLPVYAYQIGWQRYDLGRMAAISVVMTSTAATSRRLAAVPSRSSMRFSSSNSFGGRT